MLGVERSQQHQRSKRHLTVPIASSAPKHTWREHDTSPHRVHQWSQDPGQGWGRRKVRIRSMVLKCSMALSFLVPESSEIFSNLLRIGFQKYNGEVEKRECTCHVCKLLLCVQSDH